MPLRPSSSGSRRPCTCRALPLPSTGHRHSRIATSHRSPRTAPASSILSPAPSLRSIPAPRPRPGPAIRRGRFRRPRSPRRGPTATVQSGRSSVRPRTTTAGASRYHLSVLSTPPYRLFLVPARSAVLQNLPPATTDCRTKARAPSIVRMTPRSASSVDAMASHPEIWLRDAISASSALRSPGPLRVPRLSRSTWYV